LSLAIHHTSLREGEILKIKICQKILPGYEILFRLQKLEEIRKKKKRRKKKKKERVLVKAHEQI
jgi:hypothetical protein